MTLYPLMLQHNLHNLCQLSPRKKRLAEQQRIWRENREKQRPSQIEHASSMQNETKNIAASTSTSSSPILKQDMSPESSHGHGVIMSVKSSPKLEKQSRDYEDDIHDEASSRKSSCCLDDGQLPFHVLRNCCPGVQLQDLLDEVELRQDSIYLDGQTRVITESRLTGWQSNIGATFKYSGKEMQPSSGLGLTPEIARIRDMLIKATGVKFDSVLINLYPDGRCGMRFHADPLYDCWTPNSAVVSIGQTRKFIFRETNDFTKRWEYLVNNGDVVFMFEDCQDRMQHCVKVEREDRGAAEMGPRMSLVFKQRIQDPVSGQYAGMGTDL